MPKPDILYKGVISGVATSIHFMPNLTLFNLKIKEKIEGIPEEFFVIVTVVEPTLIREGDEVLVDGELYSYISKKWQKEIIKMIAKNVYNETLKCGYP